jgi:hypothetical protein
LIGPTNGEFLQSTEIGKEIVLELAVANVVVVVGFVVVVVVFVVVIDFLVVDVVGLVGIRRR